MPHRYAPTRSLPALVLLAALACPAAGHAADDGSCVGAGEYKAIKGGMSIGKLQDVLHGQAPFAETAGKGKHRFRWYVACDAWKPDSDVKVRYLKPVVGRRTVTQKALDVYAAPPAG